MFANDPWSLTSTEVPVKVGNCKLDHLRNKLGARVPQRSSLLNGPGVANESHHAGDATTLEMPIIQRETSKSNLYGFNDEPHPKHRALDEVETSTQAACSTIEGKAWPQYLWFR